MRQHYTPERARCAALDFLAALVFAALIGAPFIIYFWSMKA
jgi:hypothetical protein